MGTVAIRMVVLNEKKLPKIYITLISQIAIDDSNGQKLSMINVS